ncbi:MAG: polysaccharide deacetylase family protein [Alphaproteobacteria bacterium]|nr:polysaccharide deacetylase family protein [Alphaproteobacteria bacterium]
MIKSLCILAVFFLLAVPERAAAQAVLREDSNAAVILAYHRVGEESWPESTLRAVQFQEHLQEIAGGCCAVRPLPEIIQALKKGENLPARAMSLTFQGAYRSAEENAMRFLVEQHLPFTIFLDTRQADSGEAQYLGWDDLRRLQKTGLVAFGLLAPSARDGTQPDSLHAINAARARFREELGEEARLLAYPSGEYTQEYKALIEAQGFDAAFGLHSGAAYAGADMYVLPRFTMTESYGDPERFRLVMNALPLPVTDMEPEDPYLKTDSPAIGFSVPPVLGPFLGSLSCFVSGQAVPSVEVLGQDRVELRLAAPVSERRTRVNCTMPGPKDEEGEERWRWLGMILIRD